MKIILLLLIAGCSGIEFHNTTSFLPKNGSSEIPTGKPTQYFEGQSKTKTAFNLNKKTREGESTGETSKPPPNSSTTKASTNKTTKPLESSTAGPSTKNEAATNEAAAQKPETAANQPTTNPPGGGGSTAKVPLEKIRSFQVIQDFRE